MCQVRRNSSREHGRRDRRNRRVPAGVLVRVILKLVRPDLASVVRYLPSVPDAPDCHCYCLFHTLSKLSIKIV